MTEQTLTYLFPQGANIGVGKLSVVAGQKQTLLGMAGHTDFPPLILFILLFMMLTKHGNLYTFN